MLEKLAVVLMALLPTSHVETLKHAYNSVHATTLVLGINDDGICSGTAIGQHTLLSAAHCFENIKTLTVNGRPTKILAMVSDNHDHELVRIDRVFTHIATFGPTPDPGDLVFMYGAPAGIQDQLQVGRVSGHRGKYTLYDVTSFLGDSGAAIFDEQGRIVGVVSAVVGGPSIKESSIGFGLMVSEAIKFSARDWAKVGD